VHFQPDNKTGQDRSIPHRYPTGKKMKTPQNLHDQLENIRLRPAMYFGSKSLKALEGFIYGYHTALRIHKMDEEPYFSSAHFNEWLVYAHKVDSKCKIMGWTNYLLESAGNEEKAFDKFFKLYEEFTKLKLVPKKSLRLIGIKKRSKEYYELNQGHEHYPIPVTIELIQYYPTKLFYLKYHYEDGVLIGRNIWRTLKSAIENVRWEFGIGAEEWLTIGVRRSAR
jgi:hypothetical protein